MGDTAPIYIPVGNRKLKLEIKKEHRHMFDQPDPLRKLSKEDREKLAFYTVKGALQMNAKFDEMFDSVLKELDKIYGKENKHLLPYYTEQEKLRYLSQLGVDYMRTINKERLAITKTYEDCLDENHQPKGDLDEGSFDYRLRFLEVQRQYRICMDKGLNALEYVCQHLSDFLTVAQLNHYLVNKDNPEFKDHEWSPTLVKLAKDSNRSFSVIKKKEEGQEISPDQLDIDYFVQDENGELIPLEVKPREEVSLVTETEKHVEGKK